MVWYKLVVSDEYSRTLENRLWTLEQQYEMIIKSAENYEIMAADLRGRAEAVMNSIREIRRVLDQ